MFKYLKEHLNSNEIVSVAINRNTNVLLLDTINFNNYKSGQTFRYYGGFFKAGKANIKVPHTGIWYLVIEAPQDNSILKFNVNIIK